MCLRHNQFILIISLYAAFCGYDIKDGLVMKEIIDFKYLDKGKDELNNLRHSHGESYEILLVRSGSGSIIVRDRLFHIQPGAIYFINGMDTHCSAPKNPKEYMRGKLIISSSFIDKIAETAGCSEILEDLFHEKGGTCVIPDEKTAAYIDAEFSLINRAITKKQPYAYINIASAVFNILTAAKANEESYVPVLDNRVSEALEYINENLSCGVSLDEICEHIHVSKYYLCHMFKKMVGMTISEYVLSRRLSIARKSLRDSDMSLSEISEASGFCSFSYFSKMFRKYEGMTPSEFRRGQQKLFT